MSSPYSNIDSKLIPKPSKDLPDMNNIAVNKESIEDIESFMELVNLYNLKISYEENNFYILDGSRRNLREFKKFWASSD